MKKKKIAGTIGVFVIAGAVVFYLATRQRQDKPTQQVIPKPGGEVQQSIPSPKPKSPVEILADQLKDPDERTRLDAAEGLRKMGADSHAEAIPHLSRLFSQNRYIDTSQICVISVYSGETCFYFG